MQDNLHRRFRPRTNNHNVVNAIRSITTLIKKKYVQNKIFNDDVGLCKHQFRSGFIEIRME